MLEVVGENKLGKEAIQLDGYTFSIEWEEWKPGNLLYWRTGDFAKSLLEIGINEQNRTLSSLTLLLAESVTAYKPENSLFESSIQKKEGIPVLNTKRWKKNEYYVDDFEPFRVYLGSDVLRIELGFEEEIDYCLYTEKVVFGINSHQILKIMEITHLSDGDISLLKQMLQFT